MKSNQPELSRLQVPLNKTLLVMKLTAIFLLTAFVQVYADGFSQERVSLSLESAELRTVLNQIEKKTNYRFLYNQSILSKTGRFTVKATNEFVPSLLEKFFRVRPLATKL
jgi:hypothetical protein